MKRVVLTVTTDLNYDQRMQRICTALSKAGFDVTLIGRLRQNSLQINKSSYHQRRIKCFFKNGPLFYAEFNIRLFLLLMTIKFDVICGVDLDTALPAKMVSRIKSKPFCYDAHEYFTEVPELVDRPAIKKIWLAVERLIITPNIRAYTVSQSLADIFKNVYRADFKVVRNTAVLRSDEPLNQERKNRIIYAGAVNRGRGLEELITCMPNIPFPLVICGDGDIKSYLEKMVKDLGLENKVTFTGYLSPDKLAEEIRISTIGYLMLHFQGLSYYNSLANKFFDYMHAEIPQLCIDFPEYQKINSEFEVAVLSKLTINDITIHMNRLIDDKQLYEKLKSNCKKAKLEHNWQNESQKLIDFYKELVHN